MKPEAKHNHKKNAVQSEFTNADWAYYQTHHPVDKGALSKSDDDEMDFFLNNCPIDQREIINQNFSSIPLNHSRQHGISPSNNPIYFCRYCNHPSGSKGINGIRKIRNSLNQKYGTTIESYNVKIINEVIYNEYSRIVAVFKDFLIFDDVSEFLKRSYTVPESLLRLPKMFEFYE